MAIMTPIQKRAERVRGIALESVLRIAGAQPDPQDRHKWHTQRGVLSVAGPKFMNWSQGRGGGGAIDLVMDLRQRGFMEALEWLEHHFAPTFCPSVFEPEARISLKLPTPDSDCFWRVQDYLILERHLPPARVVPLMNSGIIYGDAKANAVFLLFNDSQDPVGAELRGSGPSSWRGMAPGSRKDAGFFAAGPVSAAQIILCESAIDAISCSALHPQSRCISTAGARPDPRWLPSLMKPGAQIYCGFDADPTGDAMAQTMINRHWRIQRLRPSKKDWNDVLKSI
jgi:hypothetical protein